MSQKVLWLVAVVVALAAAFAPDAFGYYALVLVAVGLVSGFMYPTADVATRVAYYVLAAALPGIADNLDAIPVLGGYVNGILDQLAVVIAGVAIANVILVLIGGLTAAGDE